MVYIEFAVELPIAGGAFNYTNLVFGELAGWLVFIIIMIIIIIFILYKNNYLNYLLNITLLPYYTYLYTLEIFLHVVV